MPSVAPDREPVFGVAKYSEFVSEHVRARILSGDLLPGSRINEVALSDELQISRSPLREALRSLSGEGLVRLKPGKGAFVAAFDRESVVALSELRLPLAVEAAGLAAERADAADLAAFEPVLASIHAALDDPTLPYPHHVDFHVVVHRAAKSVRLATACDEVEQQLRLARLHSGNTPERARSAMQEHLHIHERIVARDVDGARERMREHILAGVASFVALLDGHVAD